VAEQNAIVRGDVAFARGNLEEALAEYRLALLQGSEDPEIHVRAAHAYAALGRVDDAADHYREAVALDSAWAEQAVADLVRLAREAQDRGDLFSVASAMTRARAIRPGIGVDELSLPLARHHFRSGEYGRAVPYFQQALAALPPDSAEEAMYELGLAYEEVGDCARALVFFERYRQTLPRWQRGEVNWHVGSCAYRYAQQLKEWAELEEAAEVIERTIEVGEPRSLQAAAYYEKGQILSFLGDCEGALEAYRQVAPADVGGAAPLVSRARERIDEIRFGDFGGPLEGRRARCGLPEEAMPTPDSLRFDPGPPPDTLETISDMPR